MHTGVTKVVAGFGPTGPNGRGVVPRRPASFWLGLARASTLLEDRADIPTAPYHDDHRPP
jgi:hypothetical protein